MRPSFLLLALALFALPAAADAQKSESPRLKQRGAVQLRPTLATPLDAETLARLREALAKGAKPDVSAEFRVPALADEVQIDCYTTPAGTLDCTETAMVRRCPTTIIVWMPNGNGGHTGTERPISCTPPTPNHMDGTCECDFD